MSDVRAVTLDTKPSQYTLQWVEQCSSAVQELQLCIKRNTFCCQACCRVFAAALSAGLAFERAVLASSSGAEADEAQQLSMLYAHLLPAIELATQRVQVGLNGAKFDMQ